MSWTYAQAMRALDSRINYESVGSPGRDNVPTLDRMRDLCHLLGDPQTAFPSIHLTGTNGKTSVSRIATSLLAATGLTVGTYTSPSLEKTTDRISRNLEVISDAAFAAAVGAVFDVEPMMSARPSWFEMVTAAAFAWFADLPVHAGVIEVGLLGRWDATNVLDAPVAVITNIGPDHLDYAGTIENVAREKAGIVKEGATLVLGETDPSHTAIILEDSPAATVWQRDIDFAVIEDRVAHGGRLLDIRTPGATYDDLYLPLHGRYQADNAAIAVAAVEAFLNGPLATEVVEEGFANVTTPGRMEVVHRRPAVLLDGAHNADGLRMVAATLTEEFAPESVILVFGGLRPHDPAELLPLLAPVSPRAVVACAPDWPRAVSAEDIGRAAMALTPNVEVARSVAEAVDTAISLAAEDDLVLVTGSLYVVGEARKHLMPRQ